MRRRQFLALGAGLVPLVAGCGTVPGPRERALAASTIALVVPGPQGCGADRAARCLGGLARREGLVRGVQVADRPGSAALTEFTGTRTGTRRLLVVELETVALARAGRQAQAFAGTTPLARLCGEWELIAVPAASGLGSFGAFADAMRRDPSSMSVAGRAEGGVDHIMFGMLAQSLGVDPRLPRYVACRSCDDAAGATSGGLADAVLGSPAGLRHRVRAGELRVLAVSAPDRVPGLDAPTLLECDTHLYCADWRALLGPGDLPPDDRDALVAMCRSVTATASWREHCRRNGWTSLYLDGDDFGQWLRVESARLGRTLGDLGLRA
ncbi:tripartite tricarboxylate transporter substrate binding protein [Sphaerisporangium rubeum]|uniref:Putative tricarboxylic transport membrane protein n=1 Tax=Sphaerisporangium rubeum TaxID=321317 RepID=A0A7X0IDC2_9ACTN|nr:tripartite tricarboxylate transporter substrate-binding protein [Sphaerisporangium rubeum]MBB6473171.1 putative tricarboxylic transport membrane protein [Sphaerisporangium rubeum]